AAEPPKPQSFDSKGVKISYLEAGKGEPVILVHGLDSSAAMNWVLPGTFEQLAKKYHVVALDLRGHGQSDKPADDASYGTPMVDDITRLMDHLKIEKAHVAGYSLGGIIVMRLMVDHPDRVLDATLGGMGYLRQGSVLQNVFENSDALALNKTPPACVHGIGKLAITDAQLKAVKVPFQVLIGDRDPVNRLYVQPLRLVRPDVKVTAIPAAGHLNTIAKPEFKEGIEKWVEAHPIKNTTSGPATSSPSAP
ncbi:MAG TPA: alpha/beta fold hydrolase, partial [Phycisphaerae bacterium]|nr:alpha/beta fold hydrolase [Phycisphaerae bacterium]